MKFLRFLSLALMPFLFLFSCIPDRCKDIVCNNGGICVEGTCSCLNGYTGIHCDTVWREKFLGVWRLSTISANDTIPLQHKVQLIMNEHADQFLANDLLDGIDSILAHRASPYRFVLRHKQIDSSFSVESGTGILDSSGRSISANITLKVEDVSQVIYMLWEKE